MRESSHCVVSNNRACVVISSQLYDRRAIDSPLPTLPLVTSLQHLAYLTSTSPRIREILTLDGGLERLITIVGGCLDQAFPHNKGKTTSAPHQNPVKPRKRRYIPFKPFHAYANGKLGQDYVNLPGLLHTYGFALQCLVNVGVRGSEQIRTRVVEAGVLGIVSRILSSFLFNRRKQMELEMGEEGMKETTDQQEQSSDDGHIVTDTNPIMVTTAPTPLVTRHALSDFENLIAPQLNQTTSEQQQQAILHQAIPAIRRTNTPDTLASNDAETDLQSEQDYNDNEAESSGQENERNAAANRRRTRSSTLRHAAAPKPHNLTVAPRSHSSQSSRSSRRRQQNNASQRSTRTEEEEDEDNEDMQSPRSGSTHTPMEGAQEEALSAAAVVAAVQNTLDADGDVIMTARRLSMAGDALLDQGPTSSPLQIDTTLTGNSSATPIGRISPLDPLPFDHHFKEDDVLHCLHLLAYLSKYPHVRAIFHDPYGEVPPSLPTSSNSHHHSHTSSSCSRKKQKCGDGQACQAACTHDHDHEDEDEVCERDGDHEDCAGSSQCRLHKWNRQVHAQACADSDEDAELAQAKAMAALPAKDRKPALEPSRPPKSTANNVFSLVEQYTYRPSSDSSSRRDNGQFIVKLPPDIQYWAGVIMRNACRKDELRGGIRQCANMSCGVWERFPREFAKCRRCRKAKYCSKQCQRKAWQAGHRYWCSARQDTIPQQANIGEPSPPPDNVPVPLIAANTALPGVVDDDGTTEIRVVDNL